MRDEQHLDPGYTSVEHLDTILARERTVRRESRYYLAALFVAMIVVVAGLAISV